MYEYVPVHVRRQRAEREATSAAAGGAALEPVFIEGRKIAHTPWGTAWCRHIEGFHDFSNRLPRGRTYARNGSVIDLKIERGSIKALVMGSSLYNASVAIRPCPEDRWKALVSTCAGSISSMVELIEGRFSDAVMGRMTGVEDGLFPDLSQVELECSCPDWATLCKHLAAVLYGVGARLDEKPELLFTLRGVNASDLVVPTAVASASDRGAAKLDGSLSDIFGIDIDETEGKAAPGPTPERSRQRSKTTKQSPAKAKRTRVADAPIEERPTVRRTDLLAAHVPPGTIAAWLHGGVLEYTDERGVYRQTPASRARLAKRFSRT